MWHAIDAIKPRLRLIVANESELQITNKLVQTLTDLCVRYSWNINSRIGQVLAASKINQSVNHQYRILCSMVLPDLFDDWYQQQNTKANVAAVCVPIHWKFPVCAAIHPLQGPKSGFLNWYQLRKPDLSPRIAFISLIAAAPTEFVTQSGYYAYYRRYETINVGCHRVLQRTQPTSVRWAIDWFGCFAYRVCFTPRLCKSVVRWSEIYCYIWSWLGDLYCENVYINDTFVCVDTRYEVVQCDSKVCNSVWRSVVSISSTEGETCKSGILLDQTSYSIDHQYRIPMWLMCI
jgi:hypothetical protein